MTDPTKRDQTPFFRKLQNQFLLVHRTGIACRMLLGNQQSRHGVFVSLVLPQQQPTGLLVHLRVHFGNRKETRKTFACERDGFKGYVWIENRIRWLGDPYSFRLYWWSRLWWITSSRGKRGRSYVRCIRILLAIWLYWRRRWGETRIWSRITSFVGIRTEEY